MENHLAGRVAATHIKQSLVRMLLRYPLIVLLVAAYVGFSLAQSDFSGLSNIVNILRQSSYLIMLSMAQMVVLIVRGFDLSVGNVISTISVASSLLMVQVLKSSPHSVGLAIIVGCALGLGIGLLVGLINGLVVSMLEVNPFVTTLGMMGIALGFASTLSGGFPVFDVPEIFVNMFSRATIFFIPVPVWICAFIIGVLYLFLHWTTYGRSLYLIGSNPRSAYIAGISVRFHLALAYITCSLITAIVALALTARTGSGEPSLGGGLMLQSLMASVIGGVSLRGGEGKLIHCVGGGLFVTVVSSGMNFVRVNSYIQMMVLGAILIGAIFLDRMRAYVR